VTGLDQIQMFLKGFVPALAVLIAGVFGVWIKSVYKQKQRNEIDEIDLTNKKIDFDTHSKPVNQLVDESNKSHGADKVVKPSGSGDENGGQS